MSDETLLDEIRETIGEANFARHAEGWAAKAREDAVTLRECFELLRERMRRPDRAIENPGGWLHATYHHRRQEAAEAKP